MDQTFEFDSYFGNGFYGPGQVFPDGLTEFKIPSIPLEQQQSPMLGDSEQPMLMMDTIFNIANFSPPMTPNLYVNYSKSQARLEYPPSAAASEPISMQTGFSPYLQLEIDQSFNLTANPPLSPLEEQILFSDRMNNIMTPPVTLPDIQAAETSSLWLKDIPGLAQNIQESPYPFNYTGSWNIAAIKEWINHCHYRPELEHHIVFKTPRVVQKSYGSEKRFFCPQPQVYCFGGYEGAPLSVNVSAANNQFRQTSKNAHKKDKDVSTMSGLNTEEGIKVVLEPKRLVTGRLCNSQDRAMNSCQIGNFRNLYANDNIKGDLRLSVRITQGKDVVATVQSKNMKIVSKPSKTLKAGNRELCIKSGDHLALFNRIRSQTVSTRYMAIDETQDCLAAYHGQWQTFRIWALGDYVRQVGPPPAYKGSLVHYSLVSPDLAEAQGAFIQYGEYVVLEHIQSGLFTTPLVIRAVVDRATVALTLPDTSAVDYDTSLELVSEMHKVAFEVAAIPGSYLEAKGDNLELFSTLQLPRKAKGIVVQEISELCAWSLVGIHVVHQSFYLCDPYISPKIFGRPASSPNNSIMFPNVRSIRHESPTTLIMIGTGFCESMWVFYGEDQASNVQVKSPECCVVETDFEVEPSGRDGGRQIIISLDTGILIDTGYHVN